jgi:hypothetical protein
MKKVLSLLLTAAFAIGAYAADVTLDFTAQGYANQAEVSELSSQDVTVKLDKGTNKNTPKFYTTGNAVRLYTGGTLTISSSKTITKAVFTYSEVFNNQEFSFTSHQNATGKNEVVPVTSGSFTETAVEGTWTGSTNEVTFTVPNDNGLNGHTRIQKIIVTVEGEATSIDAPKFSVPAGTYYEPQTVELSAAEGATIYYTTNGADPSQVNDVYVNPIEVSQSMTIKAIAVKGDLVSEVATAEYVIAEATYVANIAAYVALGNGAYAGISNPVTVFYANGNNVWVKDDSGILCIYGKVAGEMNYKNGDIIPGGFGGYLKEYNGGPEMTFNGDQDLFGFKAATAGEAVQPEEARAAGVTADSWGHYVVIKNAKVADVSSKNFNITDASGTLAGYNSYNVTLPTDNASYNITGIVATHTKDGNTTVQLMPTEFEKIVDIDNLPVVDDLAALLAKVDDGNDYKVATPVTVVAHSGQQLYITDGTTFARVYGSLPITYKNGDVISGIAGNVTLRYGMTQVNPIAASFGEAVEGSKVEPAEVYIEEVAQADVHKYMRFSEVSLTAVTKDDGTTDTRNITMSDDTGEMLLYLNGFGVSYPESLEGEFNVEGFVVIYKKNAETDAVLEIYPTLIEKVGGVEPGLPGDVDGNNLVNGSDVTALYNHLLNGAEVGGNADVDGNGTVNGSDVTALYNLLLK